MLLTEFLSQRLLLVVIIIVLSLTLLISGCAAPAPAELAPLQSRHTDTFASNEQPLSPPDQLQVAAGENATSNNPDPHQTPSSMASPVQIALIHYKGTLQRLGCCNPGLYEADEFVVIKNVSNTPQAISGWKIVNITKGYPAFTFPLYFPCIPFIPNEDATYVINAPQSLANRLSTAEEDKAARRADNEPEEIDWSLCLPDEPLDETRMKPLPGQQGKPLPCVLSPGRSVLVFTNEIHCTWGGFSFNYGNGNIWNNRQPDTAVLYNAHGQEVSRRSYTVK